VGYFALQTAQESRRLLEEWVPKAVRGEATCCFALTEPDAGADSAGIKTKAVRERDFYVLNGEKTSITMGYDADHGIIFAKTNPAAGIRGITCFWVPLDLPGVAKSRLLHSGMKGVGACSVIFEDVRVPVTNRCGEEGKGFYIFGDIVNYQRCWVALSALGAAQGALEETIGYVLQRTAFGHPLVRFEGVAFNIVEHATRIEAARLLCYRTLSMAAQGKSPVKEAAMCKWWCPEIAFEAVHDCLLLHGHIGYSEEYPLEQRLRDVLGLEFMDSVAQIMKMIAVRQMMRRKAASL
jgi:cyclohexanecarboxyl-CoA dehydrogenase